MILRRYHKAMSDSLSIDHGGDPAQAEARFGVPKEGWLDLSTGLNAVPFSPGPMPADILQRLPLKRDLEGVLAAARRAYKVPQAAALIASPGTQALIQIVPSLFKPSAVSIVPPTYGEHAPAWTAAGHQVVVDGGAAPFSVVVHPNNPDGRMQTVDALLATAAVLHTRGGALVVDEAFADVTPELSVSPHAGRNGLIVLRSFGKFYGLAGVRLGFAICTPDMAARLTAKLGPWAVSGPALWAGTQALKDDAWAAASRTRLKVDAARLDRLLQKAGMEIVGGTALFRLAAHEDALNIFETLARAGILTRAFSDHPTWLRFGLPGDAQGWARLEAALQGWF